jgi:hypothetical protein
MTNVMEIAELLIENATSRFGDQIDLIAIYGSRVRQEAREDSDLDIFYVPADGENPPVGKTFLLDGLLFDFWAIRWEVLEGFATGTSRGWSYAPALVRFAEVLYSRTPQAAERFSALQDKVVELTGPTARGDMVRRSLTKYREALGYLERLRRNVGDESIGSVRHAGWQLVGAVWECLALANQVYFPSGMSKGLAMSNLFRDKPDRLDRCVMTIATSADAEEVLSAAEELALSTRAVLCTSQDSCSLPEEPKSVFAEAYPEIRDAMRKVLTACDTENLVAVSAEAFLLQDLLLWLAGRVVDGKPETEFNTYDESIAACITLGLPDLLASVSDGPAAVANQVGLLDQRLRSYLTQHDVDLCEFTDPEALRAVLERQS